MSNSFVKLLLSQLFATLGLLPTVFIVFILYTDCAS